MIQSCLIVVLGLLSSPYGLVFFWFGSCYRVVCILLLTETAQSDTIATIAIRLNQDAFILKHLDPAMQGLVRVQEAVGSNPVTRTKKDTCILCKCPFCIPTIRFEPTASCRRLSRHSIRRGGKLGSYETEGLSQKSLRIRLEFLYNRCVSTAQSLSQLCCQLPLHKGA